MMKEDVKHIFDRSACLNKKQIESYLSGNMITEEVYAVEHHINGCPLCSIALDGIQQRKDALEVMGRLNSDFLKDHFAVMPEVVNTGAAAYVKNLKPQVAAAGSGVGTVVKLALGIAACVGILWFIQSAGKDKQPAKQVAATEETGEAVPAEERSVVVEEPLLADTQAVAVEAPPPVETKLEDEAAPVKEVATPPVNNTKPEVVTTPATTTTKPVVTKPAATTPAKITVPPPPKTPPVTATKPKPETNTAKPLPAPTKEVVNETPKPQPVKQEPEQRPEPKVERHEPKEEPKPVAKKEEPAEELPSDPIAAGKSLMDKRNYNAAINKMRNEMRSNNKNRRQEAVMLVAKCYQQMGNTDRAKELLKTLVDEGGPEKKAAKKMLKEVDKEAKQEE